VTQNSQLALPPLAPQPVHVGSNLAATKGTLLMRLKRLLIPISPCIAPGLLKCHTCHSLLMRDDQCNFGCNRTVTKGTLVFRPKQFFVPLSPRIAAGWLEHHMWHSLHMHHNICECGRNQAITKGTLLLRRKQFFVAIASHCIQVMQTSHAALPRAVQPVVVWSKLGCNEEHFTLKAKTVSSSYLD
jgi:hypothetical protein